MKYRKLLEVLIGAKMGRPLKEILKEVAMLIIRESCKYYMTFLLEWERMASFQTSLKEREMRKSSFGIY